MFLVPQNVESAPTEEIAIAQEVIQLTPQEYAQSKMTADEWYYFDKIIKHESGWSHTAANPKSSARGLCQTMMSLHKDVSENFLNDPYEQIDWCIKYVNTRYGSAKDAWIFWDKNKWF